MTKPETDPLIRIEAKLDHLIERLEQPSPRWLTAAEAAAHLGISLSTLKRRVANGSIPQEAIKNDNAGGERAQLRFDVTQL